MKLDSPNVFRLALFLVILSSFTIQSVNLKPEIGQEKLQGAWSWDYTNDEGEKVECTAIIQDSFLVETHYNEAEKKFYYTVGGTFEANGDDFTFNIRFDSREKENVGRTFTMKYKLEDDRLTFLDSKQVWTRIDKGSSSELANPWFFSGRMRDGEMSKRPLRPRKTMKILSDTRFQWIAYNDATGVFSGTGGGTYTATDGKYVENIKFFSRNAERVGASLSFDYEVKEGEWHHTGFSSKGDPMYEIWAPIGLISNE